MRSVIGKGLHYLRAIVRRVFIAFAAPDPPSAVHMEEMTKQLDGPSES